MSDDDGARSAAARDILQELGEVKDKLAELETLLRAIALSLGIKPNG